MLASTKKCFLMFYSDFTFLLIKKSENMKCVRLLHFKYCIFSSTATFFIVPIMWWKKLFKITLHRNNHTMIFVAVEAMVESNKTFRLVYLIQLPIASLRFLLCVCLSPYQQNIHIFLLKEPHLLKAVLSVFPPQSPFSLV